MGFQETLTLVKSSVMGSSRNLGNKGQSGLRGLLLALVFVAIVAVVMSNVLSLFGLTNKDTWPIVTFLIPLVAVFIILRAVGESA